MKAVVNHMRAIDLLQSLPEVDVERIGVIGHSLGANAMFDIANQLDRQNIPIELVVTFDATQPQPVPENVLHLVNFYQENGFGKPVSADTQYKGELTNIDRPPIPVCRTQRSKNRRVFISWS